jgi:hypothetical protein
MEIASRAAEGKIYITGSGHSAGTQMREKLYQIETGTFCDWTVRNERDKFYNRC